SFIPHTPFVVPSGHHKLGCRTRKVVPIPRTRPYTSVYACRDFSSSAVNFSPRPCSPQKVATSLRRRPLGGEMKKVVAGCKDHQHHNDREPDANPHLLSALRQRSAPDRFDAVEQEVAAVEQWDRE